MEKMKMQISVLGQSRSCGPKHLRGGRITSNTLHVDGETQGLRPRPCRNSMDQVSICHGRHPPLQAYTLLLPFHDPRHLHHRSSLAFLQTQTPHNHQHPIHYIILHQTLCLHHRPLIKEVYLVLAAQRQRKLPSHQKFRLNPQSLKQFPHYLMAILQHGGMKVPTIRILYM